MYVAVLAFFPGAGPQGSAEKQGDGARVHFRPSACLGTCPEVQGGGESKSLAFCCWSVSGGGERNFCTHI